MSQIRHRLVSFAAALTLLWAASIVLCTPVSAQDAHWRATNGPFGGTVIGAMVTTPSGVIFAGTTGGLFRSIDLGRNWSQVDTGFTSNRILALEHAAGTLYVGTSRGVYATADDGSTWTSMGLADEGVSSLLFAQKGALLAGTLDGDLYESAGGTSTWELIRAGLPALTITELTETESGTLLAGTLAGIYRSGDEGRSWFNSSLGLSSFEINDILVVAGGVFSCTEAGAIYRSTDDGGSWALILNSGTPVRSLYLRHGNEVLAGTVGGMIRLSSTGIPFPTSYRVGHVIVEAMTEDSEGDMLAGTFGGGIYASHDEGASWGPSNTGLGSIVTSVVVDDAGTVYAGTFGGGVYRSTDKGQSWVAVNNGLAGLGVESLAVRPDGEIFAGTSGGHVYRSSDRGNAWSDTSFPGFAVRGLFIDVAGNVFAGTVGGLFRLPGGSDRWINTGLVGFDVKASAISPDGHLYASLSGRLVRSPDAGSTWGSAGLTDEVQALGINYRGDVFAGVLGGGAYRSINTGEPALTWQRIDSTFSIKDVRAFGFTEQGHVLVGTNGGGVYRSRNHGDSWDVINGGLTNRSVISFAINPVDGTIYAGTNAGVFVNVHPEYTSTHAEKALPGSFVLHQNYPNPFNPATNISFTLATTSHIRLEVFDLLGRRIAKLVDEVRVAGRHDVRFDARSLAGGAYLYRIAAGDWTQTKVMTILK